MKHNHCMQLCGSGPTAAWEGEMSGQPLMPLWKALLRMALVTMAGLVAAGLMATGMAG
ncbi:MAG: hypothetical protein JWR68_2208 [Polaromonas sp.]|nr:hypothetical protein [Polaromonas sp.]